MELMTDADKMRVHFLKYFFLNVFFSHESRYTGNKNFQNIFLCIKT